MLRLYHFCFIAFWKCFINPFSLRRGFCLQCSCISFFCKSIISPRTLAKQDVSSPGGQSIVFEQKGSDDYIPISICQWQLAKLCQTFKPHQIHIQRKLSQDGIDYKTDISSAKYLWQPLQKNYWLFEMQGKTIWSVSWLGFLGMMYTL